MQCANHPAEAATAICTRCDKLLCKPCAQELRGKTFCAGCAEYLGQRAQRRQAAAPAAAPAAKPPAAANPYQSPAPSAPAKPPAAANPYQSPAPSASPKPAPAPPPVPAPPAAELKPSGDVYQGSPHSGDVYQGPAPGGDVYQGPPAGGDVYQGPPADGAPAGDVYQGPPADGVYQGPADGGAYSTPKEGAATLKVPEADGSLGQAAIMCAVAGVVSILISWGISAATGKMLKLSSIWVALGPLIGSTAVKGAGRGGGDVALLSAGVTVGALILAEIIVGYQRGYIQVGLFDWVFWGIGGYWAYRIPAERA